jgi:hydroxymethylbilane synthase
MQISVRRNAKLQWCRPGVARDGQDKERKRAVAYADNENRTVSTMTIAAPADEQHRAVDAAAQCTRHLVGAPVVAKPAAPQVRKHHRGLPLRVGTRGSPLALVQTRAFLRTLTQFCPVLRGMDVFQEHAIRTTGDATQATGERLADIGGKGLFAKEIHEALADRRIDFAVHSLKDLETELPPGIVLACTLKREDARDALILGPDCDEPDAADPFSALPAGALIGSSSVRRQAQLLHARPDLRIANIRGNVQTRLDKVKRGEYVASLLALAGLRRLGLEDEASVVIDPEAMVPSACQGIVGITVRADDTELHELLAAIEDPVAKAVASAERALLASLDGSCRTPIGGYARLLPDGQLHLTGLVARADGSFLLKRSLHGRREDAVRLGAELGDSLRVDTPRDVFA